MVEPERRESNSPVSFAYVLFAASSGFAAVSYLTLYYRYAAVAFGASYHAAVAVLVLLMVGLGLGAWALGRLADRVGNTLRTYALVEVGQAGLVALLPLAHGLLMPWLVDGALSGQGGGAPAAQALVRFLGLALLMLPPLFLAGAFFPLFGRFFVPPGGTDRFRMAAVYGTYNLAGAAAAWIIGCRLVTQWSVQEVAWHVAAVHGGLAVLALGLSLDFPERRTTPPEPGGASAAPVARVPAWSAASLLLVGLSLTAFENLAYRAWRIQTIRPVFVEYGMFLVPVFVGLGLGGTFYYLFRPKGVHTRTAAGGLLLGGAVSALLAVGAFRIDGRSRSGPELLGRLFEALANYPPLSTLAVVVLMAILGAACSEAYAQAAGGRHSGRAIGRTYVLLTVGAAAGSLAPLVLLPPLGVLACVLLLAAVLAALGVRFLGVSWSRRTWIGLGLATAVVVIVVRGIAIVPILDEYDVVYSRDGLTVSTLVLEVPDHQQRQRLLYHDAGLQARVPQETASLPGAVLTMIRPDAERVFQIGYATGDLSVFLLNLPRLRTLDCADLDEASERLGAVFEGFIGDPSDDERFSLAIGDGRQLLRQATGDYDAVVVDVYSPRHAYLLYTREFLELVDQRLAPDGVLLLKIFGVHDSPGPVLATLEEVFEHYTVWSWPGREDSLLVIVGSHSPLSVSADAVESARDVSREFLWIDRMGDAPNPLESSLYACMLLADETEFHDFAGSFEPFGDLGPLRGLDTDSAQQFFPQLLQARQTLPRHALEHFPGRTGSARDELERTLDECWAAGSRTRSAPSAPSPD